MLKPLFARVLLKRETLKKVGSILVPEESQKRHASMKCKVVAVGPACDKSIEPGMTAIVGQYAGAWLDEDGKAVPDGDWFIATDEDLLAIVVDDERRASP